MFTDSFVQRRLAALADELDRLDRDPQILAKAFHTLVARSAYEALLADAARLADATWRSDGAPADVSLVPPSMGRREVLDL